MTTALLTVLIVGTTGLLIDLLRCCCDGGRRGVPEPSTCRASLALMGAELFP